MYNNPINREGNAAAAMKGYITLPFYTDTGVSIRYLDQYEVVNYAGVDRGSAFFKEMLINEGIILKKRSNQHHDSEETILAIEPHPDDFALSAAGFVLEKIAEGFSCTVLNIFSRTALKNFPWKNKIKISETELEEQRLLESKLAVEDYLGQRFSSLKMPLASLRGNSNIFSDKHSENDLVKELASILTLEIKRSKPKIILCPLGVQGHIDHLVVFDAVIEAYKRTGGSFELILYQEYPYSRNLSAYNSRLESVARKIKMSPLYIPVDDHLETICDLIITYKTQFDDINRQQMLAVIREDYRAIGAEAKDTKMGSSELMQKYFRVEGIL